MAYWSRHRAGNGLIVSSNPTPSRLWRRPCGVAWDAVPEPMVEYIDLDFYFIFTYAQAIIPFLQAEHCARMQKKESHSTRNSQTLNPPEILDTCAKS